MWSFTIISMLALYSLMAVAFPIVDRSVTTTLPIDTSIILMANRTSLGKRGDYGDTANQLGECRPVTVIFARGTIEPGNVGLLAGPPFFDALAAIIGDENLAVQGVPYDAAILGYLEGGDPSGSSTFAHLTEQAASQCPDTQIVLSGYSQGAQLVHNGAGMISDEVAARVKAVVMFGDPYDGRVFDNISENIVDTFCFSLDFICEDLPLVDPEHLVYSIDAVPAANFAASLVSV